MKSCAALLPAKSSEMIDMCDQPRTEKLDGCLSANTAIRALIQIGKRMKPNLFENDPLASLLHSGSNIVQASVRLLFLLFLFRFGLVLW